MAGVSLKGSIETDYPLFSLPQGLRIHSLDMRKMGIMGSASGGILEVSYFGLPFSVKIDHYGHLISAFKWPFATMDNIFIQGTCHFEVRLESDTLMGQLHNLVDGINHHFSKNMADFLSDRESTSEFFPSPMNYKDLSSADKGFGLGGFVLHTRCKGSYVQVNCALGYHFKEKKVLARMDTGEGMKVLDADNWEDAVTPMIIAIKRIQRSGDPWANPWK